MAENPLADPDYYHGEPPIAPEGSSAMGPDTPLTPDEPADAPEGDEEPVDDAPDEDADQGADAADAPSGARKRSSRARAGKR